MCSCNYKIPPLLLQHICGSCTPLCTTGWLAGWHAILTQALVYHYWGILVMPENVAFYSCIVHIQFLLDPGSSHSTVNDIYAQSATSKELKDAENDYLGMSHSTSRRHLCRGHSYTSSDTFRHRPDRGRSLFFMFLSKSLKRLPVNPVPLPCCPRLKPIGEADVNPVAA